MYSNINFTFLSFTSMSFCFHIQRHILIPVLIINVVKIKSNLIDWKQPTNIYALLDSKRSTSLDDHLNTIFRRETATSCSDYSNTRVTNPPANSCPNDCRNNPRDREERCVCPGCSSGVEAGEGCDCWLEREQWSHIQRERLNSSQRRWKPTLSLEIRKNFCCRVISPSKQQKEKVKYALMELKNFQGLFNALLGDTGCPFLHFGAGIFEFKQNILASVMQKTSKVSSWKHFCDTETAGARAVEQLGKAEQWNRREK